MSQASISLISDKFRQAAWPKKVATAHKMKSQQTTTFMEKTEFRQGKAIQLPTIQLPTPKAQN